MWFWQIWRQSWQPGEWASAGNSCNGSDTDTSVLSSAASLFWLSVRRLQVRIYSSTCNGESKTAKTAKRRGSPVMNETKLNMNTKIPNRSSLVLLMAFDWFSILFHNDILDQKTETGEETLANSRVFVFLQLHDHQQKWIDHCSHRLCGRRASSEPEHHAKS